MSTAPNDAVCRICYDDGAAAPLVQPCHCRGSHAFVHEACLSKWRRIQVLQGMTAAASKCEICGHKYSGSLEAPTLSYSAAAREYAAVLGETVAGLVMCSLVSPWALFCAPVLVFVFFPSVFVASIFQLGMLTGPGAVVLSASILPLVVLVLYLQSFKLTVLGSPGRPQIGLTAFGAPVEGLQTGMLLVSISAGGAFDQTILCARERTSPSYPLFICGPRPPYRPRPT